MTDKLTGEQVESGLEVECSKLEHDGKILMLCYR